MVTPPWIGNPYNGNINPLLLGSWPSPTTGKQREFGPQHIWNLNDFHNIHRTSNLLQKSESPFQNPPIPIFFNVNHLIFPTHLLILSYPNLILEKNNENHGSPWQSMAASKVWKHGTGAAAWQFDFCWTIPENWTKRWILNWLLKAALMYNICMTYV